MNGLVGARRMAMERARHQLLAGAALALNQHRRAARRRAGDQIEDRLHLRAAADDLVEAVRARPQPVAQLAVLAHEPAALDGVAEHGQHFVVLERLREVVERALLGRRDGAFDRAERRDHDDRQLVVQAPDVLEHLDAVLVGQHEVEQHGVDGRLAERVEALLGRRGRRHAVALDDEQRLERFADDFLVVDDEDRGGDGVMGAVSCLCQAAAPAASTGDSAASGSARRKRVPWPVLALARQRAAVLLDDAVGDRQAEAGAAALGFRREERIVDAREVLRRNADAGVGDLDDGLAAV